MNITKKYYNYKVRKKLLKDKMTDLAVFEIVEAYLTEDIGKNEIDRRQELLDIQKKIEEFEKFITFVRKIKI